MHAADSPSNQRFQILQLFRETLRNDYPPSDMNISIMPALLEQGLLEQALRELKHELPLGRAGDPWHTVRALMEAEVARLRERRMHQWQLDPNRRSLRLRMAVSAPACHLHPSALQSALAQALLESGLPLAMGLEKSPRPLVHLGHPLPLGVEGLSEWADVGLNEPAAIPDEDLPAQISAHCPDGLRILQVIGIPNHASPVLELCAKANWAWACPRELRPSARERLARFEAAESYEIEKIGKVGGQKQAKRVEVRHLVLGMAWKSEEFCFTTRLSAAAALNPTKLLAGILELEPSSIIGLRRLSVELVDDPRLSSSDKYETKLHNIFEDAVLLESGSGVQLVEEEDDDEPIVLKEKPRRPSVD